MNKWDLAYSEGIRFKPMNEVFLDKMLVEIESLSGKKPTTALDLGCGVGETLVKLASRGLSVTGLDSSSVGLFIAREALDKDGHEDAVLALQDLNKLKSGPGVYDLIICKLVFAFIRNKTGFLKTVHEMMHDHSVFVLMTPVLYRYAEYGEEDKPGIAVDYKDTMKSLNHRFSGVVDYQHDYQAEKMDIVTFLMKK